MARTTYSQKEETITTTLVFATPARATTDAQRVNIEDNLVLTGSQ